ncbi:hypothetical protein U0070_005798 [Myodes glareolus]|uniref:protein-tyrosine-phosphatase n=1 Tax=Myodes glareolus TaxID=447135 RepID=A0AAW0HML6_MYOGA
MKADVKEIGLEKLKRVKFSFSDFLSSLNGPLPNTCCHFWLMVWQQKTKAVVMLNRTVEKESVKCAQYWPTDDREMLFKETGFSVKLLSEDVKSYYTVHLLQLENINMEKGEDINVKQVLLNMRKYRMGLIQTPDQLRFSYMAIIEGAKYTQGDSNIQKRWRELSKEDLSPVCDHSQNRTMTEKYNGKKIGSEEEKLTGLSSKMQDNVEENNESILRKRIREDRKATTAQKVQQMKQKLNETERKRKRLDINQIRDIYSHKANISGLGTAGSSET